MNWYRILSNASTFSEITFFFFNLNVEKYIHRVSWCFVSMIETLDNCISFMASALSGL